MRGGRTIDLSQKRRGKRKRSTSGNEVTGKASYREQLQEHAGGAIATDQNAGGKSQESKWERFSVREWQDSSWTGRIFERLEGGPEQR